MCIFNQQEAQYWLLIVELATDSTVSALNSEIRQK
jgi:hypothetical protein